MKVQALILLIGLFTYISETIQVPVSISSNSKKSSCCANMHMAAKIPCEKKNPDKNNSAKCNNINCSDCPLCYNFTNQPLAFAGNLYYFLKSQYPNIEVELISDYFNKAWKPPDAI